MAQGPLPGSPFARRPPLPSPPRLGFRPVGRNTSPVFPVGLLLFAVLLLLLSFVSAGQLTSRGAAVDTLGRVLATISEIDVTLSSSRELMLQAGQQSPERILEVPDFPLQVFVSANEVNGLSQAELREVVLSRAADRLYGRGLAAFAEGEGGNRAQEIGRFSPQGLLALALRPLRPDVHRWFILGTAMLAALAAALALTLVALMRSLRVLVLLGGLALLVGLILLTASAGLRFLLGVIADGQEEPVVRELLEVGRDAALVPLRDYLLFALLGGGLTALGLAAERLSARSASAETPRRAEGSQF